mmetsp:Transcript_14175/g.20951  ORF Transcript_14175/g.20951 Transcript_14175/m.20951 type:complete len:183 (+) Transcript_14175:56-604(+)
MSRPIHTALQKTGSVVQEYHSGAAESYLTCLKIVACLRCDICMCMQVRKIWQSTYVTAWENKLEFNYPDFVCCCMIDQVGVIYYDRDIIKKVDKAGCCKPCGTHNSPCPTCFDICGEALVLYGQTCCSTNLSILPGMSGVCFCRTYTILPNLSGVENLKNAIDTARDNALARCNRPLQGALQ